MTDFNDISARVRQRFEFIEWRIFWTGRLNRRDLEAEFEISTPQASLDLKTYLTRVPGNIDYNATERAYLPRENFRPRFLVLSPERYLLQLQAITTNAIRKDDTWFASLPPVDVVPPIGRSPSADLIRPVVQAIKEGSELRIDYQSLEKSEPRTIYPHALAHDGFRWHVRAWSVERQKYRDFVLNRILAIGKPSPRTVTLPEDILWETYVTLSLISHPGLTDDQRAAVERDYQLENGKRTVSIRAALAFYFVRRHNLDLRNDQIPPERAQLWIDNYDEYEVDVSAAKEREELLATMYRSTASDEESGTSS